MPTETLVQTGTKLKEFPDLPFKIRNSLPSHPLFEPARIKRLLRTVLDHRAFWKQGLPLEMLFYGAWGANLVRMVGVAFEYWRRGDLTWFKIRQYGSLRQLISQ